MSSTAAVIVLKAGRIEKHLSSSAFETLSDFYACWSALRSRLPSAAARGSEDEGYEQHGSTRRAVRSLVNPWYAGIIIIAAIAIAFGIRMWTGDDDASQLASSFAATSSTPAAFISETINTPSQQEEFDRLQLTSPITSKPAEAMSWVVDRQQQVYFVPLGGGALEIPEMFALALPSEGITVRVAGWSEAHGQLAQKNIEITWDIEDVEIPRTHAASAQRYLDLIRQALTAYGIDGDTSVVKNVQVKLPAPTFE